MTARIRTGGAAFWVLVLLALLAVGAAVWRRQAPTSGVTAYLKIPRQRQSLVMDAPRVSNEEYAQRRNGYATLMKSPLVLDATLQRREIADTDLVRGQKDPLTWLGATLQVGFPDDGDVMAVTLPCSQRDAGAASQLVDAVTKAFYDRVLLRGKLERAAAESDFREALQDLDKQLAADLEQLRKLQESGATPEEKVRATLLEADCDAKLQLRRELKLKELRLQFQNAITERMERAGGVSDDDEVVIMQKATWMEK